MANPDYNPDLPDGPFNDPGAPATMGEACAEYGRNAGAERPDVCWILTPWDSWERNPFYAGPPVPHPESDWEGDTGPTPDQDGPREARPFDSDDIPF